MACTNCNNSAQSAHQNRLHVIIASVCLGSLRWVILGSDLLHVQFDKTLCCQLLQWVRFHQWWFYWSRQVSGYFLFLSQQVFTIPTINIWESVSFELWIFLLLLPHLRWGVNIFFQSTQWVGKLTQWLGKLGILGKNLGVKSSLHYIRIRGITGRVLTRLTCMVQTFNTLPLQNQMVHDIETDIPCTAF